MGDLTLWSTKIPLNNKKFQKILFLFIFVFLTQKCVYSQQKHQPSIKLVEPIARLLENGPVAQRLPETTCPTPSTEKDPINNVLSGIQFRVRWHDPGHLPVELAKLELFSSDAGGHLLSRLDIIKDEKKGMIDTNSSFVSMMAQIPEGLRCNLCTLRLSVELDERIQLVSCAQVSVKPAEKVEKEEEKECKEDKECLFGGSCFDGNCFCSNGRFGEQCKNENPPPTKPSFIQNSESLQSIKFPESGIELKWLANPDKNLINLGLTFDEEKKKEAARWFILGIQSTESDKNCRVAVEKWQKQKLMERSKTRAKAGGGPLVRVEQEKGENALNIDSTEPSNINQIPSINKSSTTLNIKKLNEGNTNKSETEKILSRIAIEECDTNQRWEQCPDSERECEPSCEWTAFPESIPVCPARTSEQKCGKPRCVCVEGFVRLGKNLNECKPFSFCQAPEATSELTQEELKNNLNNNENKEKQQKCPKNEIWEKCGNACEPSCQSMYSEEPCSSVCEMPGCTCTDNFVRLSVGGPCIEWTECPNLKERNEPKNVSVTVTSKTPQIGRLQCGANETINECGTVCEADCLSIFEREECHNCGKPACACRQGYARSGGKCIYWGDCPAVNSLTTTTIQPEIKNNKKSTNLQELKESPHKHSGQVEIISTTQKITTIEPSMDICKGQWKWPKGCGIGDKKCHYSIEWFLDQNSDSLQFQLETIPAVYRKIQKEEPIWSGIGFSPSGTLLDADMIVIGTLDQRKGSEEIGKLEIMDMHVDEKLEQFRPDSQQDIILQEGIFNYTDGVFKAKFSRKRRTGDSAGEDLDFGEEDGNCVRFLFPISGGRFEKNGNISVPVADSLYASDAEICVRNCKDKNINELPSSNLPTPHSCLKEFKWPANCKLENCEYRASWEWEKKDDTVLFNISSRGIGRWAGIGFSKDGKMAGSDIITGWFYDQKPYLTDRFAFAQQQPAIDPVDRQDIFDIGGALNDDIQTISFRRKVVSLDKSTDLSLAECVHFLFPVQGGRVLAHSSRDFQQARTPIGFHDQQQPISSPTQICLCDRPINFKNPEREQIGRIRRIRNIENEEEFKQNGLPFQCADIAIIQIAENSNKLLIRAIDAFGLSNDSLRRDEHWGGQQSFNGVEVFNNSGKNTIWLTKMLKDQTNSNGDLTIQQGQIQVFLSTGHGIKPEISQAEKLEFALIDLMAGVGKENIQNTKLKHQTTTTSIFTSLPTTPNTPENITEIIKTFSSVSPKQQKVKEASSEMENSEENVEGDKEIEKKVEEEAEKEEEPNEEQLNKEDEEESSSPPELSKTSILTDENCFGGFAYPEDCMQLTSNGNIKQCQYMLQWMVIPELTKVIFQLNVRMPSNHWTGVGFSNDGSMTNSDAIIAILGKDGRIIVQDRFSPNYDKPVLDTTQNIEEISSRSVDGLWALNFSRSLYTQDDLQDADLRQCQHFIFLHTANPLTSGSEEMKKHIKTPIISENMICLGKCGQKLSSTMATNDVSIDVLIDESTTEKQQETTTSLPTTLITTRETEETTQTSEITFAITETTEKQTEKQTSEKTTTPTIPSTPSPEQEKNEDEQMDKNLIEEKPEIVKQQNVDEKYKKKIFNVAIKLPNEKWDAKLGEPESEEFSLMSQKLRNSLQSLISIRWPSLQMINVQKFAEGSVLALLQMTFNTTLKNNEELPTTKQLKHFLKEAAAQKMPAELVLDSEMLEVQENEEEGEINDNEIGEEKEKIASAGQWQGWFLAVLGTFMLLSIATALLFCAFRNRKHQRQHQTYPTKHHSSLHRHNQNNLRTNTLFFNGSANNYNQSHYIPFPGEKEDRASENSTTAKTNNSGGESCNNVPNGVNKQQNKMETPRGIGEASYREWFKKVASKDTPTHYQENYWQIPPPTPLPRSASHGGLGHGGQQTPVHAPSASPYLSYPNDPTYYTLNGEHRIVPPPPAYYRPF